MSGSSRFQRLSAPGTAGLHVFGLSGPALQELEVHHLQGRRAKGQGLEFARLVDGDEVIDEVVMRRLDEDLEFSVHGGPAVEARVRQLLLKLGFIEASAAAAASSTAALALRFLQTARTRRQVLYFARMADGALDYRLQEIAASLPQAQTLAALKHQQEEIEILISRAHFGLAMTNPPIVALRGPVNAGKSSLFNELAGDDRVIVSALPGTTRDAIEALVDIEGFPFRLIDLAGERATDDPVELLGQAEGERRSASADLILDLNPASCNPLTSHPPQDRRVIAVASRADEVRPDSPQWRRWRESGRVLISTKKREGIDRLKRLLVARSAFGGPANEDMPGPFDRQHLAGLSAALKLLPSDRQAAAQCLLDLLA